MPVVQLDEALNDETREIARRLFGLRHRFRVGLPENIAALKQRLSQAGSGETAANINDFDLFYNVGNVFSRQTEPITMGELSRSLNVPLSTATRIMDWLVENGYARRLPDPADRRIVRVALTAEGSAMYREIDSFFMERVERLMQGFTPDERSAFLVLLGKIIRRMEQEA